MSSSGEEPDKGISGQPRYDQLAALVPPGQTIGSSDNLGQRFSSEAAQIEIERRRIQNSSALVDVGLRFLWALFLGYLLLDSVRFEESVLMKVGRGELNYSAYPSLLDWMVGFNFAKITALATIVVRYLFPSKDTLEEAVSSLRDLPVIGKWFGKAKESSSSNDS